MSPFKCNFCGVSRATSALLNVHTRNVHTKDNNYIKCYFCPRSILSCKLESHVGGHTKKRPYMCHFKCKAYKLKGNLSQHYKKHHGGFKLKTERISTICYFCGKNYKTPHLVDNHLRGTHTLEKPFKCYFSKCLATFSTTRNKKQSRY